MSEYFFNHLKEYGFIKHRVYYYIKKNDIIMVLYKQTFRGQFHGLYLCFIHDFMDSVEFVKGKYKLPFDYFSYPLSIDILNLEIEYSKYQSIREFEYNLCSRSRELHKSSKLNEIIKDFFKHQKIIEGDLSKEYLEYCISSTIKYGLKILNELTPEITYELLSRDGEYNTWWEAKHYKRQIEEYLNL